MDPLRIGLVSFLLLPTFDKMPLLTRRRGTFYTPEQLADRRKHKELAKKRRKTANASRKRNRAA